MLASQKLVAADRNRRQEREFIKKRKQTKQINLKFKAKQISGNLNKRQGMRDKFA